jgi:Leucine-rich repeat (LRR) protein
LSRLEKLEICGTPKNWDENNYSLPEEIGELQQLQHLTILNVSISQVPEWLMKLKNLRFLMIRGTDITEIPQSILLLKKLRILRIENCKVENVQFSLAALINLKHLGFADTLIKKVPPDLVPMKLRSIALGYPNRYYEKQMYKKWKNGYLE